jgi:carboxypeptidase Q
MLLLCKQHLHTKNSLLISISITEPVRSAGSIYRAMKPAAISSTQWFAPFNDLGAKTVTISNTGGTDHGSFDNVGLPGFQFIQDPIEYNARNHHSNMDLYDHLIEDDLKQIATIVAAFVYNAAQRDQKLPRKPMPTPRTGGRGGF